jgi:biotin carboxyl carrier protein
MPNYETTVDGKPRRIEITRKSEKLFMAKIDDKPHTIELSSGKIGEQTVTVKVNGKAFKVELLEFGRDRPVFAKVEEATFKVEVKTPSRKQAVTSFEPAPTAPSRRSRTARQATVEGAITAPMTGKIVSVKVKKGDQVKANQTLCVVEAMKMENEITAVKAGTVQEVNVAEGAGVNEGDTLFVVS